MAGKLTELEDGALATGGGLPVDLYNRLEELFRTLPVSAEQLRDWCHQAMPAHKPHAIQPDANPLHLLEWLLERGRLAGGQVPLLTVLRHSFAQRTQKKLAALQSKWDRLSKKLNALENHCIDETRIEEKLRLQALIDETRAERDAIERQLETMEKGQIKDDPSECDLLEQTAHHFGVRTDQVQPEPTPAKTEQTPILSLHLWCPSTDKRCHVQGWLFYPPERYVPICVREADWALNLTDEQERADFLEELRNNLARQGVYKRQVPVEFILPMELLSEPVEQWLNEDRVPLGTQMPVVVRSRDRLRIPGWQNGWQECWDKLLVQFHATFFATTC